MKTKWKLERIDWYKHGLCWRWSRITKKVFYSGNQVQISWGRISFVFERREWVFSESQREAAESADEKLDGQAENVKEMTPPLRGGSETGKES